MNFERIDATTALELIENEDALVVDIRDPGSYAAGHIRGARRLDNATVADFIAQTDTAQPVIVCCYHGNSSQGAARFLASQGFTRCYSLDGGFNGWRLAGQPED